MGIFFSYAALVLDCYRCARCSAETKVRPHRCSKCGAKKFWEITK